MSALTLSAKNLRLQHPEENAEFDVSFGEHYDQTVGALHAACTHVAGVDPKPLAVFASLARVWKAPKPVVLDTEDCRILSTCLFSYLSHEPAQAANGSGREFASFLSKSGGVVAS